VGESGDDDALLVSRLVAGDDVALGVVYDRYGPMIFGVACRVTGDRHVAGEVVQEVVMQLWERPDRVDLSRGSLRTFLAVLAHRRSVDEVRRAARRDRAECRAAEAACEAGPESDVVDAAVRAETSTRLAGLLAEMPAAQREALQLAYFDGYTFTGVARVLGIPEGTAKSRLRLALDRLRTALREDNGGSA
jgi:RNA polymerase sigma-70 factor (ECF subfamily)